MAHRGADPNEAVYPPGHNYSGTHKVPNIKQFMDSLDREKKERDAKIDQRRQQSEAVQHQATDRKVGKNRRTVHDPVTGKDVEIDDMDGDILKSVEDPKVGNPRSHAMEAVFSGCKWWSD
jgi:hypothetical protein